MQVMIQGGWTGRGWTGEMGRGRGAGKGWECGGKWGGWTGRRGSGLGRWQWGGGNGEMGRGQEEGGDLEGGKGKGEKKEQEEGGFHRWIWWNAWVDIGYTVELQADRMPGVTMAFTDSYKHTECLCRIRLQSFQTNGHFVYPCNAGFPS